MPNQPPLNPDALGRMFATAMMEVLDAEKLQPGDRLVHVNDMQEVLNRLEKNILAAAVPEVISKVEAFINQRPEYIHALKNTRSGDDMSDYSRWNGHSESRRQLAQALGWTVPHNPGETTRPEVKP